MRRGCDPSRVRENGSFNDVEHDNNQLDQSLPTQIVKLYDLVELDLRCNALSEITPNSIGELKKVIRTILSNDFFSVTNFLIKRAT